jgi:hypothetical protein
MGGRFSAHVQIAPGAYTDHCTMGTVSFPKVKRQARGVNHRTRSRTEVEERKELYSYSFMADYRVNFTLKILCKLQFHCHLRKNMTLNPTMSWINAVHMLENIPLRLALIS